MDCFENCWILSPPSLPPPPPLPHFLSSYLNLTIDCDLCSWAGVKVTSTDTLEHNVIQLSSLLIIVGVISAGCGAGIMAAILSIKRIRSQSSRSVRHLAPKESTRSHRSTVATRGFPTVPFSENTYCEAPYAASGPHCTGIDKDLANNIYAELQEPSTDPLWTRPRSSVPLDNCYLELNDLPIVPVRPPALETKCIRPWFLEESPNSSTFYVDYDSKKCDASVHYHQ